MTETEQTQANLCRIAAAILICCAFLQARSVSAQQITKSNNDAGIITSGASRNDGCWMCGHATANNVNPLVDFHGRLSEQIKIAIDQDPRTKFKNQTFDVLVWLNPTGRVVRTLLELSTGNNDLDDADLDVIRKVNVGTPTPKGFPQPAEERISLSSK